LINNYQQPELKINRLKSLILKNRFQMKIHIVKQTISILLITTVIYSCGNSQQTKAVEQAKNIQAAVKPGSVATTTSGYTMNAKINGSDWVASSMVPPDAAGRIVGYYKNNYIGLPYSKTDLAAGKKIILGENEAADIFLADGCSYPLTKGEIEITKVDDKWAEGKFFFTAVCSSTGKAVEVTDGFFRIPVSKN
jgi:hypothetical protein